jgi:hypothetical protein
VDSIFMMPQLGVLTNVDHKEVAAQARKAALEVFEKDCLIRLGTCLAPVGSGKTKSGATVLTASLELPGGTKTVELKAGEMIMLEAPYQPIKAHLQPAKNQDIGSGKGEALDTAIYGGVVGIILDGRGRPMEFPTETAKRVRLLNHWSKAIREYPEPQPWNEKTVG